jgi:hypothetical protein
MIDLIEYNKENNYQIYRSDYIVKNIEGIINDCYIAHNRFTQLFPGRDSTYTYKQYNIFSLTATSIHFYNIYKDLIFCTKEFLKTQDLNNNPVWFQSWMNFHKPHEVLQWHDHEWPYHGYMSIDPKKSKTIFEKYSISNETGFLYFGEGYKKHKVEVLEPYVGERITVGYDFTLKSNILDNISLIPII